jgi:hypothetical protein
VSRFAWLLAFVAACGSNEVAQQVTVTAKGLWTDPNDLGNVPDGALSQADNVVIGRDGIIEQRKGLKPVATASFRSIFSYGSALVGYRYSDGNLYGSTDAVTWTSLGTVGASLSRISYVANRGNLYVPTTSQVAGGYKFTSASASSRDAIGLEQPIGAIVSGSAAGTAVANNTQVAYRAIFMQKDANGVVVRSAPSGRVVFSNTSGGTVDANVGAGNPGNASARIEVYRSVAVTTTVEPSDELGLVYEGVANTPGAVPTFVQEPIPEGLIGAGAYTNPSVEGLGGANGPVPAAACTAEFRGSVFLGNITTEMATTLTLVAVGAPLGLQAADTVTIDASDAGVPRAAQVLTAGVDFTLVTTGTAAQNVRDTAVNIASAISKNTNWNTTANAHATYISTNDSVPGLLYLRGKKTWTSLTVTVSRTTAWRESTESTTVPQTFKNRLVWSKQQQPEHFPALNYQDIGSSQAAIQNIVATRDALFVFKEDGIWRLTGSGGVWDIQPLDPTMHLNGPRTAVAFENAVFALFDSGVGRVTDAGVEMLSTPIYPDLERLLTPAAIATTQAVAFGIAYHSAHKYILWLPTLSTDTVATQAYVFDSWTGAWSRWTPPTGCAGFYDGTVGPADDRLYMVDGTSVWQERKTGTDADYQDQDGVPVPAVVRYAPKFGGNPGALNHFREVALMFRRAQFATASVGFSSNHVAAETTVTLTGSDYGVSAAAGTQTTIRALVPLEKARGSQLNVSFSHAQAAQAFQLQGLSVVYGQGSTRVSR